MAREPWVGLVLTRSGYWREMDADGRWAYHDRMRRRLKGWKVGDQALVYLVPDIAAPERGVVAHIEFSEVARRQDPVTKFDLDYPWKVPFRPVGK